MKVLVTGGAGYIGSHVVRELCDQDYQVTVLDNLSLGWKENVDSRATLVVGDIHDRGVLDRILDEDLQAVFHFAAFKAAGESMLDPGKYAHNNISGTITLLNAMLARDVRICVFSSSAAVYGYPEYLPMDESHPLKPVNFYGYTKLEMENLLHWYGQLQGLRYACLRYFNAAGYDIRGRIRGKERHPANLLPVVMEVAAGMRLDLEVFGTDYNTRDGTGIRDYIHVNDLAGAHVAALQYLQTRSPDLTVNLATGKGYSVLEVIRRAREITGRPIPCRMVDRRPGDPAELVATTGRAGETLGWKPEHSDLDTLIASMWEIYKE